MRSPSLSAVKPGRFPRLARRLLTKSVALATEIAHYPVRETGYVAQQRSSTVRTRLQNETAWPKRLDWVEIENIRGWQGQRIKFPFPIVAISGVR